MKKGMPLVFSAKVESQNIDLRGYMSAMNHKFL
jgi:hypothetical protein